MAATAESLPFEDQSFDAAMAFSTVHHWPDPIAGLREMRRVARRVVVFLHDSSDTGWRRRFWLTRDYLPEVADLLVGRPSLTEQARAIGARMEPVLIPWDCADGFFEAYWRRPEAYLDENVRRGVSVWARVGPDAEQSRMAMAGHSAGGAAAISAMLADSRIRAGIDMDGATHAQIPDDGLSRPFLFLGKQSNYAPGSRGGVPGKPGPASTWERDWKLLTGWKRWLLVAGAIHASFTDLALLADQVGIDTGAGLPGARSLDITRAYVRAFFDQHLRSKPQSLLDHPSPRYPEVTFCSPEAETRA